MKNKIVILLTIFLCLNCICVFASNTKFSTRGYKLDGTINDYIQVVVNDFYMKNDFYELDFNEIKDTQIEVDDYIPSNAKEGECFAILHFKTDDETNLYPEIDFIDITITQKRASDSLRTPLGKSYGLFYLENTGELTDVSDKITDSSLYDVSFSSDKLGTYILYYNINTYNAVFYTEEPEYNNGYYDDVITEEYYRVDDLSSRDVITMPPVPKKDGHVFRGWVYGSNGLAGYRISQIGPQPVTPFKYHIYALWCPEEEYTPLEITLSTDNPVIKGKEDGTIITVTLSEGRFNGGVIDSDSDCWKVSGNDDLSVRFVERVDNRTVKLALEGNSNDKFTDSEIKISFRYNAYVYIDDYPEDFYAHAEYDVKLDEDGVMCERFLSDNAITLSKQELIKGDVNGDGEINVNDAVMLVEYIGTLASDGELDAGRFPEDTFPGGEESAKLTADEEINVDDVVLLVEYIGTIASGGELDANKFPDGAFPSVTE